MRQLMMSWTVSQIVTAVISVAALLLGIVNLAIARRNDRRREQLQARNDRVEADRLLDASWNALFGLDGFLRFADTGKLDDARLAVDRAALLDSNYARVAQYRGYLAEAEGDRLAARRFYELAISLDPGRARSYMCLALVLEGNEAISIFERAMTIEPNLAAEAHYNIALQLEMTRQYDRSIYHFSEALRRRPRYVEAMIGLASVFVRNDNSSDAVDVLQKAVVANPLSVKAMVCLGGVLADSGRWDEGVSWIEHAMTLDPKDDYPYLVMASLLADHDEPTRAAEYFEKAVRLNPARRMERGGRALHNSIRDLLEVAGTVRGQSAG